MSLARRVIPTALAGAALLSGAPCAAALAAGPGGVRAPGATLASSPGGVQAPGVSEAGGSVYGLPARLPATPRPMVSRLSVPPSAAAGAPPPVLLRFSEPGVATVYVEVSIIDLATRRLAAAARLGWVRVDRTLRVHWAAGDVLRPGSYRVSVSAHDHRGGALQRSAHASGLASLAVRAPAPAPVSPAPPAPPVVAPPAGVPTPAQTAADGAVFPVAGPHSFGGPEDRFGAPRGDHVHEGQDVLTAEGTPVLAPLAGAILSTSYQAGGAGYYAVEHTVAGLDFMFAHCQAGSLAVSGGEPAAAGQPICRAGQTGDATAPHLHFEIWVGGWQTPAGYPIDPLPYLEAWEHG